jgi:phage terminase small subunit
MKRVLDERQEKFITFYVATGNASKSADMAGYKQPKQKGYDLKKRFAPEIEERTRNKIGDKVVSVIDMTYELAMKAESEAVRLNACRDLLDRAGYKPADRQVIDSVNTTVHELSTEELESELQKLLGKGETVQ